MAHRILVPFDFSRESERALAWALELERAGGVEQLHVAHVLNPFPAAAMAAPVPLPPVTQEQIAGLKSQLDGVVARLGGSGRTSTEVLLELAFGDAIIKRARELGADMIVMGTHGRGGLRRLALGSVADFVVRHADCPVVTLRAETGNRAAA